MNELYDSIKCLCESSQRLQILNVLDSAQLDLRSLMAKLDSPRTTLQRNLSLLEERGWIEETQAGYTATTAGGLILEEVVRMDETIETITSMAPFLAAVDAPPAPDIDKLTDVRMTMPVPAQPNVPMKRLLDAFDGADCVRGCLPVISWVLVEHSHRVDDDVIASHEYVISRDALDALHKQYAPTRVDRSEPILPARSDIYITNENLPYGLFITKDRLALAAYDENDRIHALVESTSETAIAWGERMYDHYKQQSQRSHETDMNYLLHSSGTAD